jgi:hypothetical protein
MKKRDDQSELDAQGSCCGVDESRQSRPDILFWIGLIGVSIGYLLHLAADPSGWVGSMSHSIFRLMNQMWLGLALGIIALGLIGKVPRARAYVHIMCIWGQTFYRGN